ncbi:MAG: hypothetical protein ABI813_04395 [Bacteroidota bacterium]
MKKTIAGMVLMIVAVVVVQAQQPHRFAQQRQHHLHSQQGHGRIAKKLNFSDQQKQQSKEINADYHKKIAALKKNDDMTLKEFRLKMGDLRKSHRELLQALLTPAQKDQLAAMKLQKMQLAKVNAGARSEKMKIKLGLTDEQSGRLKTARSEMVTKRKSIRTDNSLSREQKHEQIKALAIQQKEDLKSILTADQLQQLDQMKATHHRKDFGR